MIGDEVRDRYYLSAYNNETQQWIVQNVELTLRAPVIEEVRDEYASFREPSRSFSLDLGMGSMRDFASNLGDSEATPSFPYAASLHYQFHNVCTIANL